MALTALRLLLGWASVAALFAAPGLLASLGPWQQGLLFAWLLTIMLWSAFGVVAEPLGERDADPAFRHEAAAAGARAVSAKQLQRGVNLCLGAASTIGLTVPAIVAVASDQTIVLGLRR